MFIHEIPQRSDEWHLRRARCLVTASDAGPWLVENDKKSIKARRARIRRWLKLQNYLGGDMDLQEIQRRESRKLDKNLAVQRGIKFEDQAAEHFEKLTGLETEKVGIITTDDDIFGASADRLICYVDEGLEIKVPEPDTHIGYVIDNQRFGGLPDYEFQVHFSLAVSGFDLWHFFSYSLPYFNAAGKWVQDPQLHVKVKPGKLTDDLRKGMERMKKEMEEERAIMIDVAIRQARGEETAIHEPKV